MTAQRSIVTDPCRRFGAPCVPGTRLDVELVAGYYRDHGIDDLLHAYDHLTRDGVLVACWYVARHGRRRWRRLWGDWERSISYTEGWWLDDWSGIPLPPRAP